ncbi:MAG: polymerase beta domain protein region [Burkholderiales bacterium]|jgi:hypothetical protein|nr:polymerase beta domain protein region [Burkholderiales bacterium]
MISTTLAVQAEPLLKLFTERCIYKFKDRVIAIFKIGSLGSHGDFSLCSDVDVALMLDEVRDSDYTVIQKLINEIKAVDLEYADRLSVFWSSYNEDTFKNGIGRFPPLDRLDFIRHGILLTGTDFRSELPIPTQKEVVLASAEFIISFMLPVEKFNELKLCPEKIIAKGARYFTKFVLFPVRLLFTLDHPGIIGTNKDSVEHFNKMIATLIPEAKEIINSAYDLRNTPANSVAPINPEKLRIALLPLYVYCINRYQDATLALENMQLANKLELLEKEIINKI